MPDMIEESVLDLLKAQRGDRTRGEGGNEAYKAATKLFAKTQYAFYVAFQATTLALAIAVAAALILFISRLAGGIDVVGVVGVLGSLATGTAAGFLQKSANDAKKRYDDAMTALKEA